MLRPPSSAPSMGTGIMIKHASAAGNRLLILAGLPGAGKSTLGQGLARALPATYLRIDTLEQGLRDLCAVQVEAEGYRLAYRIAADNLRLGLSVVADSCNPVALSRQEWQQVAQDAGAEFVNIEVICSDQDEHRARVETRSAQVPGLKLPTWEDVQNRDYEPWDRARLVVDSAARPPAAVLEEVLQRLRLEQP